MEVGARHKTNEKSEAEKENDCRIDIVNTTDPVVESINRKLKQHDSSNSTDVCIHRVPETLRNVKPEAYSPTFISIGPFHSGRKDLVGNSYKPIYLEKFLALTELTPNTIVKTVESLEKEVWYRYPDQAIKMTREEFLELLVLDGCFVVMHLIVSESSDLSPNWFPWKFWDEIFCDLLLLENQLPFFLFESLYDLYTYCQPSPQKKSFLQLARSFIEDDDEEGLNFLAKPECFSDTHEGKVNHFVDLLNLHFTRDEQYDLGKTFHRMCWPPTATALYQCGVIFRRGREKKKCAVDVVFLRGGYLELPLMIIDDGFETRVRNLMAYEQCRANDVMERNVVRNFTFFMQCLVQTDQDVKLLIEHGIIENDLGSIKEVTQIFNSVCKHVDPEINLYNGECKKMKEYCRRRRHFWMTTLRRNYFSTPWTCASSIAAILLLALTFVQTVGTLVQVKFFRSN